MSRFLILLLAIALSEAKATDFIVSNRDSAASDTNAGTAAQPLKTISAAAAKVRAGDHVLIRGGDYRETVIITASGTEAEPIIFEAAPNETPVIKGSDILRGWERDEGAVWKIKLPPLPLRSEDGKNASYWNTNDVRQVFTRDGALLDAQRLRRVAERTSVEAGTFFCDASASLLFVWLADSGSPNDQPLEIARRGAWLNVFGNHVTVSGLAMRHASTTAFANWPACNVGGENNTVQNCMLSWGDFAGISLSGRSNRLSRSVVACHGASGVGGTGENHLIENCRILFNNTERYNPDWHAGGAKLIPTFKHGVIRENEFAHNLGPGLWLDDLCDQNVIDANYAHDNEGPGIMVEASTDNLVSNNISVSNRNFLSGPYRNAAGKEELILHSEQRIAPSRLFKSYHAGDGRGIYVSSSPNTRVINNTAYLNEAEGICVEGPPRGDLSTRDYTVMNNISAFNHGSQLTVRPSPKGKGEARNISDYNLLFSVGAVFAKNGWEGTSTFDLTQWQKVTGQDQHSFDADPRFAMPAMEDFRLLKTSAALLTGRSLEAVDHDYFGNARGKDKSAIGACETPAENSNIVRASRP